MARLLLPESLFVSVLQRFVKQRPLTVSDSQPPHASFRPAVLLQPIQHLTGSLRPDRLFRRFLQVIKRFVMFGSTVER